jgi:MFS family permease
MSGASSPADETPFEADPLGQRPGALRLLKTMVSLLASYGLLMAGTGLFNTFIGLRAGLEGFSSDVIGFLVAAYYFGLVLGTLRCGLLVNRIGHIRAFAAFSSLIATATLVFPFVTDPYAWLLLRAIIGFNVAGVFMVAESWLNHRATPSTRGTLLSMYMMTSYLCLGGGQLLMNVGELGGNELFMLASMLFGLAVVPVAITRATHPPPVERPAFDIRTVYRTSPTSMVACACSGLSVGALWGLAPIFARNLGLGVADIAEFMSVIILSALLFQFPVGRLSDRFDRRKVMLAVSLVALLASVAMVVQMTVFAADSPWDLAATTTWLRHSWWIVGVAALYGGVASTLYPLGVAYANDYAEPSDAVAVTAGLVLSFGVGAAIGPIPAGALMQLLGPEGLFVHTGLVALNLSAFILYRTTRRSWASVAEKEAFVALPEATSTPVPLEADPRLPVDQNASRLPRWMWILNPRRPGR